MSELVTNAVVHARSPARVVIDSASGSGFRVEVYDQVTEPPQLRGFDPDSLSGRGLALVDAISDRWGVEVDGPETTGKWIWFEVDTTAREPLCTPTGA